MHLGENVTRLNCRFSNTTKELLKDTKQRCNFTKTEKEKEKEKTKKKKEKKRKGNNSDSREKKFTGSGQVLAVASGGFKCSFDKKGLGARRPTRPGNPVGARSR